MALTPPTLGQKLLNAVRPGTLWPFVYGGGMRLLEIQRFLNAGGDVRHANANGWTLAHFAAENVDPAAIRLLHGRGADLDAADSAGATPLMLALDAECDSSSRNARRATELPTVRALIECGADELRRDRKGGTAQDIAAAYDEERLYDAETARARQARDTRLEPYRNALGSLVAEVPPHRLDAALVEWRWLIRDDNRALFLSASGDVFLEQLRDAEPGEILWLNTGEGTLRQVASSVAEFLEALRQPGPRDEWLLVPVLPRLKGPLTPGQCFGFAMLPVLGGSWEGENRVPIDGLQHVGFTGHVHGQIKNLPDGSKVQLVFK